MTEHENKSPDNGCDECHLFSESNGELSYCPECFAELLEGVAND
jgi:hypothetical protein